MGSFFVLGVMVFWLFFLDMREFGVNFGSDWFIRLSVRSLIKYGW